MPLTIFVPFFFALDRHDRARTGCWALIPLSALLCIYITSLISFHPSSSPTNMSLRHMPRQPDRVHDSSSTSHHHPLVSHSSSSSHPPHLNGGSTLPATPGGMSNGSNLPNSIISPATVPTSIPPNGAAASSSMIHRLALANEQTWLLIGEFDQARLRLSSKNSKFIFRRLFGRVGC